MKADWQARQFAETLATRFQRRRSTNRPSEIWSGCSLRQPRRTAVKRSLLRKNPSFAMGTVDPGYLEQFIRATPKRNSPPPPGDEYDAGRIAEVQEELEDSVRRRDH
jgi:hypothetical protein